MSERIVTVGSKVGLHARPAALFVKAASAQPVAVRIAKLERGLEEAPKTRAWKLRAKIGRRKRWYEIPEEVTR